MSESNSDLKQQVGIKRYRAIRQSVKRQLTENGNVDPDIVYEELWEDEPHMEVLEKLTHKQVDAMKDSVEEEVAEDRREALLEAENQHLLKAGFNSGIRRDLSGMGATFYD